MKGDETYLVRVLGHDGQVIINDLVIQGAKHEIEFAVPPRISDVLAGDPDDVVPIRTGIAVYERTAGDGIRIYRVKVEL